jgi:hypothetical protein
MQHLSGSSNELLIAFLRTVLLIGWLYLRLDHIEVESVLVNINYFLVHGGHDVLVIMIPKKRYRGNSFFAVASNELYGDLIKVMPRYF